MSEYLLFITPDTVRRTNTDEQLTLSEGACIAHIHKGRASYELNGTEYSLSIPAGIMNQDDEIASAVRIHMNRERERIAEANVASSSYNLPESETVIAVDDSEEDDDKVVVGGVTSSTMGNNDLLQALRSDNRRDLMHHEHNIRSLMAAESKRVNDLIAQQKRDIQALQAEVGRLNGLTTSLSRIINALTGLSSTQ